MPEVSVIIPTYNSAGYVTQAIESVLRQTFRDFEILVIDDGSTDETEEVMRRYDPVVRYIRQSNGGVAVARNRGIQEARGQYVAFLDADDTWFEDKLGQQIAALRITTHYRVCYSAFTLADSELKPLATVQSKRVGSTLEDLLLRGNIVGSICTVMCQRSLFEVTGGFDDRLSQCADWDMWVRLAAHTEFLYLHEPTVTYRQHGSNMSRNAALLEHDSVRVLEKGFQMATVPDSIKSRRRTAFARNYMVLAGTYFHARRHKDFLRCAARSVSMDVKQLGYLASFPLRIIKRFRLDHAI